MRELERQPGLSRSPRTGQRDQSQRRPRQPSLQRPDLLVPADQIRWREWQQAAAQLIDDRVDRCRPCALEQRVARLAVELERACQRTYGVEMGAPSLPSLE